MTNKAAVHSFMSKLIYWGNSDLKNNTVKLSIQEVSVNEKK